MLPTRVSLPSDMSATMVTWEQIEKEHRQERAEDARRMELGLATPEQIQAENSLIPRDSSIHIVDLPAYLKRVFGRD